MGFLAPALLLLGLAIAVPVVLHLLRRKHGRKVVFPALRYLRRAEVDHARRIKLRNWLLLALRVAAIALLALAAARPFVDAFGGAGDAHKPTAVAIVLDNSLSSGLVVGDRRVLDRLKARALEALDRAGPGDRFWLVRAGQPWLPAVPGDGPATAARVRATKVAAGAADLGAALERARALLAAGAGERHAEIHLLSDLQATSFEGVAPPEGDPPPVVVWNGSDNGIPQNAAVTAVEIGGGLAPRAGERSRVVARVAAPTNDSLAVRLALEGGVVAAERVVPGAAAVLPFPARRPGLVSGRIAIDASGLRGDDRRYFAVQVRSPPAVAVTESVPFVEDALAVLADAGRIRRVAEPTQADVVLAPAARGLETLAPGRAVVVLAPRSPAELPAVNRRLASAGIPWRLAASTKPGAARFRVPEDGGSGQTLSGLLSGVRLERVYRLEPEPAARADTVLLALEGGGAWAVRGARAGGGRYLLVASPLSAADASLPTSAAMLPLLDRLVGAWAAGEPIRTGVHPGERITVPPAADALVRPDGERVPVEGGAPWRAPAVAGVYRFTAGDSTIAAIVVNPPASESTLKRLDGDRLRAALAGWDVEVVDDASEWTDAIYRAGRGRALWQPLLALALALLLIEGWVRASGRNRTEKERS